MGKTFVISTSGNIHLLIEKDVIHNVIQIDILVVLQMNYTIRSQFKEYNIKINIDNDN